MFPTSGCWWTARRTAHKEPAYLRLNPNGLIPVLTDGDLVLYETAAIVLHLCDTHPQAGLAPAAGHAAARALLQVVGVAVEHPAGHAQRLLLSGALGQRGQRRGRGAGEGAAHAKRRPGCWRSSTTWWRATAGRGCTGATTARWTAMSSRCAAGRATFPQGKARELPPAWARYLQRMSERPALQRVSSPPSRSQRPCSSRRPQGQGVAGRRARCGVVEDAPDLGARLAPRRGCAAPAPAAARLRRTSSTTRGEPCSRR